MVFKFKSGDYVQLLLHASDLQSDSLYSVRRNPKSLLVHALGLTRFLSAWTARAGVHWIASVIGITIYATTVYIILQCVFGKCHGTLYHRGFLTLGSICTHVVPSICCKLVCRK
jgi:hypothetical protein